MSGISIHIRGDTAGLRGAMRELTAAVRQLSKDIQSAFKPAAAAATQTAAATKEVTKEARRGSIGLKTMVAGTIAAISAAAGLAGSLVMLGKEIPMLIRIGRTIVMSVKEPLHQAARESQGLLSKLAAFSRTPAFKVLIAGAAAAVVGGVVLVGSFRMAMGVLLTFGRMAGGIFRGVSAAARATANVVRGVFGALRGMIPNLGGGGGSLLGPLAGIVGLGGALALVVSQLKSAFEAASGFEDLQVRVESFTGSVAAAKDLLADLRAFGDVTPFTSGDLQEAAASLLGAGVRQNVKGITKDLAAVSKSGQVLGELADALGKGFAKGKFQTEELNKFLERGINLMPQFTAVTGLAGDELRKAIEKGLKFDVVTESIRRMSAVGGQFFGLLARQSMTFRGLWSTFTSGLSEVKKAFATPILMAIKPLLQDAIQLTGGWAEQAKKLGSAVGEALLAVYALVKSGRTLDLMRAGMAVAFQAGVEVLKRGLQGAVAFLVTALPPVFQAALATMRDPLFWGGVGDLLQAAASDFAATILEAMKQGDEALAARNRADGFRWRGGSRMRDAGGGVDFTAVLQQSFTERLSAAAEMVKKPMSAEMKAALANLAALKGLVGREMEGLRKGVAVPAPEKGATGTGIGTRSDGSTVGGIREALSIASSLARIGGGGFGMMISPMLKEQQKGNELLRKIERNTSRANGAAVATYA